MKYQLNEDWLDFKTAFARELAALGATGEETEAALDIAFANVTECDDVARCACFSLLLAELMIGTKYPGVRDEGFV